MSYGTLAVETCLCQVGNADFEKYSKFCIALAHQPKICYNNKGCL